MNIKNYQYQHLCLFFLLFAPIWGRAQSSGITDGPYVFYRGDKMIVKSVIEKSGKLFVDSTSFPASKKKGHILNVHIDKHPEWDFTVALKDTVESPVAVSGAAPANTKTLIASDIEGEFEPFRNLLLAAKVTDAKYNWTFGKGRLIIAGDLFDRGKQVCQFLWLLYKLEDEAQMQGGEVHVILGNHDIMNLSGNFGYVQGEYKTNAAAMNETYRNFYSFDSELGIWLRSKNIIEKIGDLLVMHAGLSPQIVQMQKTVEQINNNSRPFYDIPAKDAPFSVQPYLGTEGPFWYRGYFLDPKASIASVDSTLSFYNTRKIIVGHDVIPHVAALYSGKIIGVDVDEHQGTHEALLIEKGKYYRMDDQGNKQELSNQ